MKKSVFFLILPIILILFSSCNSARKTDNDDAIEDAENIADSEDIDLVEEIDKPEDIEEAEESETDTDFDETLEPDDAEYICTCNTVEGDEDLDGIPNTVEGCNDDDYDGIPNCIDSDSDSDRIPDSEECPEQPCRNTDGNGGPDYLDRDSDDDGLSDGYETEVGLDPLNFDTDGDGTDDGTERHIKTDPLDSSDPSDGVIYVYIIEGSYKKIKLSMISGIDDIAPEQDYTVKDITLKTDEDYGCQYYENYYNLMPGFETVSAFPENGIDSMDETTFYSVQKSTEITFKAVMAFSFCEYEYELAYDRHGVMIQINFVSGDDILKSQPVFVILKALG